MRLLKSVSAKFTELDADNSGVLEGQELLEMAEWIIKTCNPSKTYSPSKNEIIETRNKILLKFNKAPTGTLSMRELAIINEEIMRKRRQDRSAMRYKSQVKNLIVELLSTSKEIEPIAE